MLSRPKSLWIRDTIMVVDSITVLYPSDWNEYELVDSGNGEKLERFASYTVIRPDPRALWQPACPPSEWDRADARYIRTSQAEGHWRIVKSPPSPWKLTHRDMTFILKPTDFKHVGIFPEQSVNWNFLNTVIAGRPLKILNLFAYTGGATLASLRSGAHVTHVDSLKAVISWANENVIASGLSAGQVRWIVDDAYKFVTREIRRNARYDGIIMDPPRFGRGSKGEVFKLSEDLPKLISACKQILAPHPAFFLVNAYTADLSSLVLSHLVSGVMKEHPGSMESGELTLLETYGKRLLPSGIFARWRNRR